MGATKFSVQTVVERKKKVEKLIGEYEGKTIIEVNISSILKKNSPKFDVFYNVRIKTDKTNKKHEIIKIVYLNQQWLYKLKDVEKMFKEAELKNY